MILKDFIVWLQKEDRIILITIIELLIILFLIIYFRI